LGAFLLGAYGTHKEEKRKKKILWPPKAKSWEKESRLSWYL